MTEAQSDQQFREAIKNFLEQMEIKFRYSVQNQDESFFLVGLGRAVKLLTTKYLTKKSETKSK